MLCALTANKTVITEKEKKRILFSIFFVPLYTPRKE